MLTCGRSRLLSDCRRLPSKMLTDKFIQYIASVRRYSPRTQAVYHDVLEEFVAQACADATDEAVLQGMNPTAIRNYEVWLLDTRKESPRTVAQHVSVLSSFGRWLMKEGLLATNPARSVSRPKQEKRLPVFYRASSMEEYFSQSEYYASEENLDQITGADKVSLEWYRRRLGRLVISLLYGTGVRRAELISLNINQLDQERRILHVRGKGDKMREIPMIPALCHEICLYLQATETVLGRGRTAGEPLLVTEKGARLYPMAVQRIVAEELGSVGSISGRRSPHVLRHTLATGLLDQGADLNSIKELLGHSSLAATQVYTHNSIEKLKNVYNNAHPRAKRGGNHGD